MNPPTQQDARGVVRCIAPVRRPKYPGQRCGSFVTREPDGYRFTLIGLVAHSTLADPASLVFPCSTCGHIHEVRQEAVDVGLRQAA